MNIPADKRALGLAPSSSFPLGLPNAFNFLTPPRSPTRACEKKAPALDPLHPSPLPQDFLFVFPVLNLPLPNPYSLNETFQLAGPKATMTGLSFFIICLSCFLNPLY